MGNAKHIAIRKRVINEESVLYFKEIYTKLTGHNFTPYATLIKHSGIYDHAFPVNETRKTLLNIGKEAKAT